MNPIRRTLNLGCQLGVLALGAAALPGCQSVPAITQPDPPADFTIAVTVFDDDAEVFRSARYIVEPDGTLRAGFGNGATTVSYPPWVRQLTSEQRDELWSAAEPMRIAQNPRALPTDETFVPGGDPVVVVAIRTGGRWRYAAYPAAETDAPRTTIRLLDELSWATPEP